MDALIQLSEWLERTFHVNVPAGKSKNNDDILFFIDRKCFTLLLTALTATVVANLLGALWYDERSFGAAWLRAAKPSLGATIAQRSSPTGVGQSLLTFSTLELLYNAGLHCALNVFVGEAVWRKGSLSSLVAFALLLESIGFCERMQSSVLAHGPSATRLVVIDAMFAALLAPMRVVAFSTIRRSGLGIDDANDAADAVMEL